MHIRAVPHPWMFLDVYHACSGNILALQFFAVQAEVPTFVHGGPIDQAFVTTFHL